MITYVTGGVRSGKSRFAMDLALQKSANPVYVATSRIWDEDFALRVKRHQNERGLGSARSLRRHRQEAVQHQPVTRGEADRAAEQRSASGPSAKKETAWVTYSANEPGSRKNQAGRSFGHPALT